MQIHLGRWLQAYARPADDRAEQEIAMKNFIIRQAGPADMAYLISLAKAEGWNPGLQDGDCFYAADPDGFFIAEQDGQPVGCISAVRYQDFGFIGLYIVESGRRGGWYGVELGRRAMAYLAGCRIGLDGVVAKQDNYRRAGFTMAHRNMRFAGSSQDWPSPDPQLAAQLAPAAAVPFPQVAAYDRLHFPANRDAFLRCWLQASQSVSLAYLEDGTIRGLGTLRPCSRGWKVGPLFADTPAIAETLLLQLGQAAVPTAAADPGVDGGAADQSMVYLDLPDVNAAGLVLARRLGMAFVFETARMYAGDPPELRWDEVYGITTFELG